MFLKTSCHVWIASHVSRTGACYHVRITLSRSIIELICNRVFRYTVEVNLFYTCLTTDSISVFNITCAEIRQSIRLIYAGFTCIIWVTMEHWIGIMIKWWYNFWTFLIKRMHCLTSSWTICTFMLVWRFHTLTICWTSWCNFKNIIGRWDNFNVIFVIFIF